VRHEVLDEWPGGPGVRFHAKQDRMGTARDRTLRGPAVRGVDATPWPTEQPSWPLLPDPCRSLHRRPVTLRASSTQMQQPGVRPPRSSEYASEKPAPPASWAAPLVWDRRAMAALSGIYLPDWLGVEYHTILVADVCEAARVGLVLNHEPISVGRQT